MVINANRIGKAIFGEGEEPKGILAEVEAQAAREKEQEDEEKKRADAVDMMKHIAAAFDIPATIGEGKQEEQEKEAKLLFGWYSELKKAGFTDAGCRSAFCQSGRHLPLRLLRGENPVADFVDTMSK